MKFHCVNDGVPLETTRVLRAAAAARGVEYVEIAARSFAFDRRLRRGDLLFRPAVSLAARRVEQFLHRDGVASFYRDEHSLLSDCTHPTLRFERDGLPIPLTFPCTTRDRAILRVLVERLGGLPVVVKVAGGEGGVGVVRVDSLPSLFSTVDALHRSQPLLCQYIADAVHYRLVVVGDEVVAAYRNVPNRDDFRTHASDDASDYRLKLPRAMQRIAQRAVALLGVELGGVDVLQDPRGALYLLEANFPCFFAQAELVAGVDVSGRMLDHLIAKSRRLQRGRA